MEYSELSLKDVYQPKVHITILITDSSYITASVIEQMICNPFTTNLLILFYVLYFCH